MFHFFRVNAPYRLLGFLFIFIVTGLPFIIDSAGMLSSELKAFVVGEAIKEGKVMYVEIYDNTPPLASAVFGFMSWVFGRSLLAWRIVALAIIFFQASYFALFLINARGCKENTLLPALLFGMLYFFSFDTVALSMEVLGACILLVALKKLLDILVSKTLRDGMILGVGIAVGLSTFAVFSYWVFLLAAAFILLSLKSVGLRRVLLLIFGFLLPHLILITLYYFWNVHDLLLDNFYIANLAMIGKISTPVEGIIIFGLPIGIYLLFSLLMTGQSPQINKRQSNVMQIMFIWLAVGIAHIFLSSSITPSGLIILIPPLSHFINHGLLLIRRKTFAEMMLWIFLGSVLGIGFSAKYGKIDAINYSALFPTPTPYAGKVKDKKILILGKQDALYQDNMLGGFFPSWELSRPLFENVSSYRHIEKIALCFETAPPEVIVDEENLMPPVMEKIPHLREQYTRKGDLYVLN